MEEVFNSSKMREKTWCYNAVLKCMTAAFKFDLNFQCFKVQNIDFNLPYYSLLYTSNMIHCLWLK